MKKKIDVTFEVSTQIEVEIPDDLKIENYIVSNKEQITEEAKINLLNEGIQEKLSWDNLIWQEHNINNSGIERLLKMIF